jgi:hypothetical protein
MRTLRFERAFSLQLVAPIVAVLRLHARALSSAVADWAAFFAAPVPDIG